MTMQNSVILITNDGMGRADTPLQHTLVGKYLELLLANNDQLAALEQKGVRLVICSTCLNYFGLTQNVRVGIVGGMGDILAAQTDAEKVITL